MRPSRISGKPPSICQGGRSDGKPLISDALWELIEPLLPKRPPRPKGGCPPVPDRDAMTGIVFVLKTGIPWEDWPAPKWFEPVQELEFRLDRSGRNRMARLRYSVEQIIRKLSH